MLTAGPTATDHRADRRALTEARASTVSISALAHQHNPSRETLCKSGSQLLRPDRSTDCHRSCLRVTFSFELPRTQGHHSGLAGILSSCQFPVATVLHWASGLNARNNVEQNSRFSNRDFFVVAGKFHQLTNLCDFASAIVRLSVQIKDHGGQMRVRAGGRGHRKLLVELETICFLQYLICVSSYIAHLNAGIISEP